MWLVLCSASDGAALWTWQGLRALGLASLQLVTAEELAYARFWVHRLGVDGVSAHITLADGRVIQTTTVRGAVNRLLSVLPAQINLAVPTDREYALQEMMAFHMSWLHALPGPVLNRPTPQGLCGRWRHVSEWVWLAGQAGLLTPLYKQTGYDILEKGFQMLAPPGQVVKNVIVVNHNIFGPSVPEDIAEGCHRLAELCETNLLGVDFYAGPGDQWIFAGATPMPDLRIGGWPLLQGLAEILSRGENPS